jgi:hypothetical protein
MPSKAYSTFNWNITDVQRLINNYNTLNSTIGSRGRRALDHLTRSGVLLLAGAWEVYIEDLVKESATHLSKITDPSKLPSNVKKTINNYVRKHDDESKPFSLIGDGWRNIYLEEIVVPAVGKINTPKSYIVDKLFSSYLGIENISNNWNNKDCIDDFISFRGNIAHRVKAEKNEYVKVEYLEEQILIVRNAIITTDTVVAQFLSSTLQGRLPWNCVYKE